MELKFSSQLGFQKDAISSVTSLFEPKNPAKVLHPSKLLFSGAIQNILPLLENEIFWNLRQTQIKNNIIPSESLSSMDFTIDMETGTGKTYIYIRTILELFLKFNLQKFIIIVPSVAIRESVLKTLDLTRSHFATLYNKLIYHYFAYSSKNIVKIREFAQNNNAEIMVITLDSFNKESNIMNQPSDHLNGFKPIDLIRSTSPILVLDEPQNMESDKAIKALASLDPLLKLRYSATHKKIYNLIYRLSPVEAINQGLVKKIEISSVFEDENNKKLQFASRGEIIKAQIREAIKFHFEKRKKFDIRGIKTLTLFFIDRVSNYQEEDGDIRKKFIQQFEELQKLPEYREFSSLKVNNVHTGYFSKKKKQSSIEADKAIFKLIMRDKERLLSFDEPVQFIFSHSALKEGWDNPNVFNICTLNLTKSKLKKKQEIGRGLRLPVNKNGERQVGEQFILTVIANESYIEYVSDLQKENKSIYEEIEAPPLPKNAKKRRYVQPITNFYEIEYFKQIWEAISTTQEYWIHFNSDLFIRECTKEINSLNEEVQQLSENNPRLIIRELAAELELTEDTLRKIFLKIPVTYKQNEDEFERIHKILHIKKRKFITRDIEYTILDQVMIDPEKFEAFMVYGNEFVDVKKTIYPQLSAVGEEKELILSFEKSQDIMFYVKFPSWINVQTPFGDFHPDWVLLSSESKTVSKNNIKIIIIANRNLWSHKTDKNFDDKYKCAEKYFINLDIKLISELPKFQ